VYLDKCKSICTELMIKLTHIGLGAHVGYTCQAFLSFLQ